MKKMFNGFYETSNDELKNIWSNPSTLFVFDTNVLLNLYSYVEKTRNDFFNLIEKSIINNIWIPYHVGLEYQRNRLKIIKEEKKVFTDIQSYLISIEKALKDDSINNLKLGQRLPNIKEKTDDLHKKILLEIEEYKKIVEEHNKKHPDVRSEDKVRKKIDKLFSSRIGNKPSNQEWLDAIYEEGKERYKNHIPPGYKDIEKEKENNFYYSNLAYIPMYGDLIIWKQLLEKAKEPKIKAIIFITDDIKEDWRFSINSNGPKLMGARAELREEIFRESDIEDFMILTTFEFMEKAKETSKISLDKNTIKEIEINFNKNKNKVYKNKLLEELNEIDDMQINYASEYLQSVGRANRNIYESSKDLFENSIIQGSNNFYKNLAITNYLENSYKTLDNIDKNIDKNIDTYLKSLNINNSTFELENYIKRRKKVIKELEKLINKNEDDEGEINII